MLSRLIANNKSRCMRIWTPLVQPIRFLASKNPSTSVVPSDPKEVTSKQAPNRVQPWSESQEPRSVAMQGARFEQIDFTAQPLPPAAIEMIRSQPVIKVHGRVACCDGGGGALGHPKVYINLDRNEPNECGYCGLRFQQEHSHH